MPEKKEVKGVIERISGSLVVAGGMEGASMQDVVHIGELGLVGEILEINSGVRRDIRPYARRTSCIDGRTVERRIRAWNH